MGNQVIHTENQYLGRFAAMDFWPHQLVHISADDPAACPDGHTKQNVGKYADESPAKHSTTVPARHSFPFDRSHAATTAEAAPHSKLTRVLAAVLDRCSSP